MASIESSPSPAAETDIVTLRSSDGEMFEVEPAAARMSRTIRCMMEEEDNLVSFFPVFNVTGPILAKVAEYIRRHASAAAVDEKASIPNDALIKFDKEFIMVDQDTLFDIMLAAHYLDIKSLLDLTCRTVADMMRDRRPEEIRQTFHIKNDYTPEEEEEVRRENAWAFARRENTWAFDY